jgi:hypothetical protein
MGQIRAALEAAWPNVVGGDAPDGALRILGAQIALETANGTRVNGNNLGNVKSTKHDPTAITFPTFEYVWDPKADPPGMKRIELAAGDPGAYFRAWPDLASGAAGYLQIMIHRFGAAWPFVLDGDTAGFAQALKDEGYYTADEGAYARGLVARGAPPLGQIAPVAEDDPAGDMSDQDDTASAATNAGESDDS